MGTMARDLFTPPPELPPRSAWSRECSACGACCTAPDIAALGKRLHTPCRNLRPVGGRELCAVYPQRPGVCRDYAPDWVCGEVSPLPTLAERSRRFLTLYGFAEGAGPLGVHSES